MLRGEFPDAGETSPEGLLDAYDRRLRETLTDRASVAESVDGDVIESVRAGEVDSLTLSEAADVLALDPALPDGEAVAADARDILLMGMTTAVMDVDALASAVDAALEPKEIQQKVEGRFPMTLEEYALLHHTIEAGAG
jgi:hypothetical protein